MKNIFVSFFALLLSLPALSASWKEIYTQTKPSIPLILTSGGICSGSLVDKDLILTAAHCASRLRPMSVSWEDSPTKFERATVVALDKKADIALLRLRTPTPRRILPIFPKSQRLPEGSQIATIGHPTIGESFEAFPFDLDMTYVMSSGIISRNTKTDLITDMSVSPGNSGGPVFNENGEIVGVVSRKRIDRFVGSIGFIVAHEKVHELLEKVQKGGDQKIPWYRASASADLYIGYATHSVFKELFKDENTSTWYLGLNIDFWDRLRTEFADNFSETQHFQNYALGYKMLFEMPNRTVLYLTPTLEYVHYGADLADGSRFSEHGSGLGLHFTYSGLPLAMKYSVFKIKDETESFLSLILVL